MNEVDSSDLRIAKLVPPGVQDDCDITLIHGALRVVLYAVRGLMSIRLSILNSCEGNKSLSGSGRNFL